MKERRINIRPLKLIDLTCKKVKDIRQLTALGFIQLSVCALFTNYGSEFTMLNIEYFT